MKLLGRGRLVDFLSSHADARSWIAHWIAEIEETEWTNSQAIKSKFPAASFLKDNIVVFNVKGNRYRLVVHVAYQTEIVVVTWIGTHAEYSKRYFG
ncbi:MAG TPA: type II toxin-antitoxin system HigB family toxin [Burkholderiales bacterium]|nr:type II toxin-antitoxin system HigB family toxin [Burkholderiales bacterium]